MLDLYNISFFYRSQALHSGCSEILPLPKHIVHMLVNLLVFFNL